MNPATTKPGPEELLRSMGAVQFREAYKQGLSLSAWLEREYPSTEYKDGLDAFSRMLKLADIRVRSLPEQGVWSHKVEKFFESEATRALFIEYCCRQWRAVTSGRPQSTRSMYSDSDHSPGSLAKPFADALKARTDKQIAPAIPVSELIATTTPIDGDAYRAYFIEDDAAQQRKVRVAASAPIPTAKLKGHENEVRLYKYGRALEAPYEFLRRIRIDRLALTIQRMAAQSEIDKVAAIIDVIVNGDGNNNAATSYNLTALDGTATVNNPTLIAWLAFKMKFANPYMLTHVLAQEGPALKAMTINTGSANIPLVMIQGASNFGSFRPINPGLSDGTGIGWTADAPANKWVGIDARFLIERVTEIGATITEADRFIRNQTEVLAMTEVDGYAKIDNGANVVVDLAA